MALTIKQPKSCNVPIVSANARVWAATLEDWKAYKAANPTAVPASGLISAFPTALAPWLNEIFIGKDELVQASSANVVVGGLLKYRHNARFMLHQHTAAQLQAIHTDSACGRIVVIVELDGIAAEGKFKLFGDLNGLEITAADEAVQNYAENGGAYVLSFHSATDLQRVEDYPPYSIWDTDEATTLAAIASNVTA